jgi:hypothetical protein
MCGGLASPHPRIDALPNPFVGEDACQDACCCQDGEPTPRHALDAEGVEGTEGVQNRALRARKDPLRLRRRKVQLDRVEDAGVVDVIVAVDAAISHW